MNRKHQALAILLSLFLIQAVIGTRTAAASVLKNTTALNTQEPAKPKQETKEEDCGCDAKPPADVAAVVNGTKIPFKDVDDPIKAKIDEFQKQVIEARKIELERQINGRVLQNEAKKRGVSAEKLENEILARAKEPTEADAQAYYDQNKEQIQSDFDSMKESIIAYLRRQRQEAEIKKEADKLRGAWAVQVLIPDPQPPKSDVDRARVLATISGAPIKSADIEAAMRSSIFDTKQQIYLLRKQSLEARISTILLEEEARKRNTTAQSLYETEVAALVQPIKESDARKFYEENKDRISGGYIQVRGQIIEYLEGQEQTRATAVYAEKLKANAKIQSYLTPPDSPYFEVAIDDQPSRGNPNAPVTIVEFTDFQCPVCGRTQPVLEKVISEMGDKVRLVVRDFPLEQHTFAEKAAEAAEAARAQGKYWEYVTVLFQNQTALSVEKLKEYATQVGLDRAKFDKALDSGQYADQVKRDLRDGNSIGVSSTPSIFVNGRKVQDKTEDGLKSAIEAALKAGSPSPAKKQQAKN